MVQVYDYVDITEIVLARMCERRQKSYGAMGFELPKSKIRLAVYVSINTPNIYAETDFQSLLSG